MSEGVGVSALTGCCTAPHCTVLYCTALHTGPALFGGTDDNCTLDRPISAYSSIH